MRRLYPTGASKKGSARSKPNTRVRKSHCENAEGTGKVVHDHTGVMHLQEGEEIEGAVLDLCQERRGGRQALAIEGLAEGVDELRAGVEDRHGRPCRRTRHVDRTFLAEPEAQSQRPSCGSE